MSNVATMNRMKPYKVIEGSSQAIETFEEKVAMALESGYTLAGELVTSSGTNEVKFFQPVIWLEEEEDEYEDEDEDEDEYEEDEL